MDGCVSFPLENELLRQVVPKAKDYMLANGIILRTQEEPGSADKAVHAPFTLLPSPVPSVTFSHARSIQRHMNLLMHSVAHDHDFLQHCLQSVIKQDDFTARMWEIHETVRKEGSKQAFDLAILRSDYMLDSGIPTTELVDSDTKVSLNKITIKQIEVNTIAASLGGLCSGMTSYHQYILDNMKLFDKSQQIPENPVPRRIAEGFVAAWRQYGKERAIVLFVVQDVERNVYDQRKLEYATHAIQPHCQIMRRTISQLKQSSRLGEKNALFVDNTEVAVVYLRALYTPNDFKSDSDWTVRLLLERSAAIKCPSIDYQLAGTKKVQQELARPCILERYVKDPQAAAEIRKSFAQQYSLDMGEEGDETVAMAMKSPEKFVLKPQREGGGNNIFGEEIRKTLEKMGSSEERSTYILMERVHPVPIKNYPIISGVTPDTTPVNMVSELGIFGIFIGNTEGDVLLNEQIGHNLRTKAVGVDEGGVSAGFAAIDSPFLVGDGSRGQTP